MMDEILFDPEDAAIFARAKIKNCRFNYRFVYAYFPGKSQVAARVVMNAPPELEVDHINGNTLDCRKANLRLVTHAENCANKHRYGTSFSGYRGVSRNRNPTRLGQWRAQVGKKYLGSYIDKVFAAAVASTWRELYMPGARG